MAEFIRPGTVASCTADMRARRIWSYATSAVRLGGGQPLSEIEAPLSAQSIVAFLLKGAGVPRSRMARLLRVSDIGLSSLLGRVRAARRDAAVAAWLDGLARDVPKFDDRGEAA